VTRPLAASGVALTAPLATRSADLSRWVRSQVGRLPRTAATVMVCTPAPVLPPDALLQVANIADLVLWDEGERGACSGVGIAREVEAWGPDRFTRTRVAANALLREVAVVSHPDARAPAPRLLGGFSFRHGSPLAPPWETFGEARLVLPRLRYDVRSSDATLTLTLRREEVGSRQRAEALADVLLAAHSALQQFRVSDYPGAAFPAVIRTRQMSVDKWSELVTAIGQSIANGQVEKVVAARRTVLRFERAPDALAVLNRLRPQSEGCVRFAFRRAGNTFLGATPERLVSQRGLQIRTEALAGSIRSGADRAAKALLGSAKDLAEHALVVRELVRTLADVCDVEPPPSEPQVVSLPRLLHLRTPVHARRRRAGHVLDLVARLHPTPAVGGVPTEAALDFIAANEPDSRGWYAGPFGWVDPTGDGDFAVALRSGVVRDSQVHLYAGAGIVRGSEAQSEYGETDLKLATLRTALGVPS